MPRKSVITLVEAIVIIVVLLFVWMLFFPRLSKPPKFYYTCPYNLKSLGTALNVYANDYEGRFPQLPGTGPWSKQLGFAYDNPYADFKQGGAESNVGRTITASWYLLVREADVYFKTFVCNEDPDIAVFGAQAPRNLDVVELWDFGSEPHRHVSYAMHNPYGAFPATSSLSASFAVASHMSPWFHWGDILPPDESNKDWRMNRTLLPPFFQDPTISREKIMQSNIMAHGREGQTVLFADGHSEYRKTTDAGINHDNIFTYWSAPQNPTESDIRIGANPTSRSKENDAQSAEDSFLAI
jgi:hypothetical protein